MVTIVCSLALCGGQGKTTSQLFLGKLLALQGYKVLAVDADPQHTLTTFLGHELDARSPSLLEVLKRQVDPSQGIYETSTENLSLIPSDRGLQEAETYLAGKGNSFSTLRQRLRSIEGRFDWILIDPPPTQSQITFTVVGAADRILIPAETTVKGVQSLSATLDFLQELVIEEIDEEIFRRVIGVIPFRDRYVGRNQTRDSRNNVDFMRQLSERYLGEVRLLPSIVESEITKRAMFSGKTPWELGASELKYPFDSIIEETNVAAVA